MAANPYTPGYDAIPPILAGRDYEQEMLAGVVSTLAEPRSNPSDMVIYGPRGNGKSALLNASQREFSAKTNVRVMCMMATQVANAERLYRRLLDYSPPQSKTIATREAVSISVSKTGGSVTLDTSQAYQMDTTELERAVETTLVAVPTLLMIDEAHRITSEGLNTIQELAKGAKHGSSHFNFVLAGPPALPDHLRSLDGTFLNRATTLRIDRLSDNATRTALFQPMKEGGYSIDLTDEEADSLILLTQRYPHFIQSIGHAIWEAAYEMDTKAITPHVLAAAEPAWQRRMDTMFADRIDELANAKLMPYAAAVAQEFDSQDMRVHIEQIEAAVARVQGSQNPSDTIDALKMLGYIWRSDGVSREYEPAIPSLIDHVLMDYRKGSFKLNEAI